jgi:flagellin-like protein
MTTRTRHLIKEEEAVSPVIGVILMVAITVILAAVIGAFVFGMGGSLKKTYVVGVTATQTSSNAVDVTFQGGPDAGLVHYINVTIGGNEYRRENLDDTSAFTNHSSYTYTTFGAPSTANSVVAVGTAVTLGGSSDTAENGGISAGRDHVVATACFLDGTKQIILDTYV